MARSIQTEGQIMNTAVLALDLNNNFSAGSAVVAGLVGAVAMLMVIYGGRAAGMTSMDLLRTLGTMVARRARVVRRTQSA